MAILMGSVGLGLDGDVSTLVTIHIELAFQKNPAGEKILSLYGH